MKQQPLGTWNIFLAKDKIIKAKKLIESRMKNDIDLLNATICLNLALDFLDKDKEQDASIEKSEG